MGNNTVHPDNVFAKLLVVSNHQVLVTKSYDEEAERTNDPPYCLRITSHHDGVDMAMGLGYIEERERDVAFDGIEDRATQAVTEIMEAAEEFAEIQQISYDSDKLQQWVAAQLGTNIDPVPGVNVGDVVAQLVSCKA